MSKSNIIKEISFKNSFLNKKLVSELVEEVFNSIASSLIHNERVEIRGFGAFSLRKRKVQTKFASNKSSDFELKTRNIVYFRAGKDITEKLNEKE